MDLSTSRIFLSFLILGALLVATAWIAWESWSFFWAEAHCSTRVNSTLRRDKTPSTAEIRKAVGYQPENGDYYIKLAYTLGRELRTIQASDQTDPQEEQDLTHRILETWSTSLQYNPVRAWSWYRLALYLSAGSRPGRDRIRAKQQAERAREMARALRPNDPELLYRLGSYWLWRSRHLPRHHVSAGAESQPPAPETGLGKSGPRRFHLEVLDASRPKTRKQGLTRMLELFAEVLDQRPRLRKKINKLLAKSLPEAEAERMVNHLGGGRDR